MTEASEVGWITWGGGYAPVDRKTAVNVKHRDGWAGSVPVFPARDAWWHRDHDDDIIAYRVVQP